MATSTWWALLFLCAISEIQMAKTTESDWMKIIIKQIAGLIGDKKWLTVKKIGN